MHPLFILIYNLAIQCYYAGILFASPWNRKAKQWLAGRKNQFALLQNLLQENEKRIWFHCASAGEFEQGRPLMEACRKRWPQHKIVLTFFSPSGYEQRKSYAGADYIFYLPLDTSSHARQFVSLVKPSLAIFVKYEFWYQHLKALQQQDVPVLLISGIFRKEQLFFQWYGKPWRNVLRLFRHFFLQDQASLQLLKSLNIQNATVTGDTRFDRVWDIALHPQTLPVIQSFNGNSRVLVAGSTWPDDEKILEVLIRLNPPNWKFILVPHELNEHHLNLLKSRFQDEAILYSSADPDNCSSKRILIVDAMGLLSSIYSYGNMAYVGGGFGKGIHNVVEAAVYGLPVIFGPHYQQFNEAVALLAQGGAASVHTAEELIRAFHHFNDQADQVKSINRNYVASQKGATDLIMDYVHKINSGTSASAT